MFPKLSSNMRPPLTLAALAQAGSYQVKSIDTAKKLFQDHYHLRSSERKQARDNSNLKEAEIQYYEHKLGKTAQKREKDNKQELSYLYRQLLGKLNQQEIDAKLKEIITWAQDSWPTQFNFSETKLILYYIQRRQSPGRHFPGQLLGNRESGSRSLSYPRMALD